MYKVPAIKTCLYRLRAACLLYGLAAAMSSAVLAANPLQNVITMGFRDLAQIRLKAEAGDPGAQVTLADSLAGQYKAAEALPWYRKAAAKGKVSAKYEAGRMLLFGATGIPAAQSVAPNPPEGLRWTYEAATKRHWYACWNMGTALRHGMGTSTNVIAAYAWMKLAADSGMIVARVDLNRLALELDSQSLRRAEDLAAAFKAGNFQTPQLRAVPEGDGRLRLGAITLGKTPTAMINGKILTQGESVLIAVKPRPLRVKCLAIKAESVLISLEGEDSPRQLTLK